MMLTVDVISDVICPWCYVSKRRLEKAIPCFDVRVRWLPFQLNPRMPKEGISRKEYRTAKFGTWERSLELDAKMGAIGEAEGIINGKVTLSGAQPVDEFIAAFNRALGRR
jgi:predicted DsbA family dithiol-disulfide isomerase